MVRLIASSLFALLLLFLGWAAHELGIYFNFIFLVILLTAPVRCLLAIWRGSREVLRPLWRSNPDAAERKRLWIQWLNRSLFWALSVTVVASCVVPAQFEPEEYRQVLLLLWGATVVQLALEVFPGKHVSIPFNVVLAIGSMFMARELIVFYKPPSVTDAVTLESPFKQEWIVVQGGASSLMNHHYAIVAQRHALDVCVLSNGLMQIGPPEKLESYASWSQPLFAPCDGAVRKVVNDLEDNPIGETDAENLAGNYVVIEMAPGRYVLMAHLKKGSVRVAEGDIVKAGDEIAECGNSGNTSDPHLHLQVQDHPTFAETGPKTFPVLIKSAVRVRGGKPSAAEPVALRRNDRVIPSR